MQLVVGPAPLRPGLELGAAGGASRYQVGTVVPATLDVLTDDGAAADPTAVTAELLDATGAVTELEVTRPAPGHYVALATPPGPGVWRVRWTTTGSGAAVTEWAFVVTDAAALPFAATVEGVRARVLDVSRPAGAAPAGAMARAPQVSNARVAEWLLEGGARVARKLRLLDGIGSNEADPVRQEYRAAARGLTEQYAASLLWDATYPAATGKTERYGAVLMAQFKDGLAELATDLALDFEAQPDPGEDAGGVDDGLVAESIDPYDLLPGGAWAGSVLVAGVGAAGRFPARDVRISRHRPW